MSLWSPLRRGLVYGVLVTSGTVFAVVALIALVAAVARIVAESPSMSDGAMMFVAAFLYAALVALWAAIPGLALGALGGLGSWAFAATAARRAE